jgi:hypothetical protein
VLDARLNIILMKISMRRNAPFSINTYGNKTALA